MTFLSSSPKKKKSYCKERYEWYGGQRAAQKKSDDDANTRRVLSFNFLQVFELEELKSQFCFFSPETAPSPVTLKEDSVWQNVVLNPPAYAKAAPLSISTDIIILCSGNILAYVTEVMTLTHRVEILQAFIIVKCM